MEMIAIMTALLAGWGSRKKSASIREIRKTNQAHRITLRRIREERAKEQRRERIWFQIDAIRDDYTEAVTCCG